MGLETQLHKVPARLRDEYIADLPNIQLLRNRAVFLQKEGVANASANGHLFTREMRPVEVAIVEHLVPDARAREGMDADPKVRTKAWKWVLKQDWGRELAGMTYARRF